MSEELRDFSIHHAGTKPFHHSRLGVTVNAQTAVRYLRFCQRVRIERLELPHSVEGRWVPAVPTHPAHLIISVLDPKRHTWKIVREVNLPRDPRIESKGLSQRMSVEEMDAHFKKVLDGKPHVIRLGGIVTDHLRIECDREHPVWPNHGECNGSEFMVPFGILNPLKAFGKTLSPQYQPRHVTLLKTGKIKPSAPRGMSVKQLPLMLLFEGRKLAVGFSLRRPMLLHLGWDVLGKGRAANNRLVATNVGSRAIVVAGGLSGPSLRTLTTDCLPHHWTGDVSVQGNRVSYRNLRCSIEGVRVDATFTVEPERIVLELAQTSDGDLPAIEANAWRLNWDIDAAMTGAAAMPTLRPGRNGEVQLPMLWAGDGVGCLSCRILEGAEDRARLRVESYRTQRCLVGGIEFGAPASSSECAVVPRGTNKTTLEWAVTNLEPKANARISATLASHWAAVYSCFRPEYGGFSNHAISVNCHVNQHCPNELVAHTRRHPLGLNPLDLYRFTIERALLGGGGYGFWRNLYLDSDPMLICGAGRIHQTEPRRDWLRKIEAGLIEATERMLGTIGKEGLAICRSLSGNSGSYRWSSNAMDVVGFGHMDAYVNAWTYRALRNATALLSDLDQTLLAQRCRQAAGKVRAAFPRYLVNPKTGWIVGWRSRDGKLHDCAFTWVNAPACAFGVLDGAAARRAMTGLEKLREEVGAGSGLLGVPFNLLPIPREDHMLPKILQPTIPTFELYTDGAMGACAAGYYLRALSICGLKANARKLAKEAEEGYAAGLWTGGTGSGVEFRSWDGLCTGYEGTFVANFIPLYAIAIEQGVLKPTEPEWWPANG